MATIRRFLLSLFLIIQLNNMIVGRKEEIKKIRDAYSSGKSEFIAIYGRRRIGKTFLIRELFEGRFTFQYTGIFNVDNATQLREFYNSLLAQGLSQESGKPSDWFEAFRLLEQLIAASRSRRKVIFIDELPWMDARNSKFVSALEHFWNGWASARKDIMLIICGSASSWIINKIFRNRGGLYNRVTCKLRLKQFTLSECEELAKSRNLPLNRNMIMEGYMVMGGVPYYWAKLDPAYSMAGNINNLFLSPDGELHDEFNYIYASMFKKPEKYVAVITALSGKKSGMTREQIIKQGKLESNGRLSRILEDLIECGFVRKFCHPNKKLRDALYQLTDCYSLFYHQFGKIAHNMDEQYWVRIMRTPLYNTWCGLAFERVCLLHLRQIKKALGISGILSNVYSWHVKANSQHTGVQIDLLIDRADNVVNVCEMKYAPDGFRITDKVINNLQNKLNVLRLCLPQKKYVEPVLVTSNGLISNKLSGKFHYQISAIDHFFVS